jgi:GR25 family glycosyltransferase involved in LPS biosynthesis
MINIYKNIILFEMRLQEINFFYINCKKDKIKNERMISQWEKCSEKYGENIPLIRRDAVHYLDYTVGYYDSEYVVPEIESKITGQISNIAVYKSHINLWKYIFDNRLQYALVLEDDVIIPEDFLVELDAIMGNTPENWDILFFGILRMMAQKTKNSDFHRMLNKKGYNNGLHCYLVNKQSTKKLLKLITKVGAINQIDILLRDQAHEFNFFIYKKLLVKQDVDNIESTRLGRFVKEELKKNFDEINLVCEEEMPK